MASGYAPQMEKLAGMGLGEQREFVSGNDTIGGSAKQSTTDRYGSDFTTDTTSASNSINAEQPKGPAEMEAVTVVWSRNWLIAAYSA
jgi:hypothetical protein